MKTGVILDAKYKGYSGKSSRELSREDLAQIISYMYVEEALDGGVIAPGGTSVDCTTEVLRGYGGKIHVLNIPISNACNYNDFSLEMRNNEDAFIKLISSKF